MRPEPSALPPPGHHERRPEPEATFTVVQRANCTSDHSAKLQLAQAYLRQRERRAALFGADIFREPAWDIMLDLYCARLMGKKVGVMDACIASRVPSTTGFRHAQLLVDSGLVTRHRDGEDRRRTWLELTDAAAAQIEAWLSETWPARPSSITNGRSSAEPVSIDLDGARRGLRVRACEIRRGNRIANVST